jgi:ankyrin repeat protein
MRSPIVLLTTLLFGTNALLLVAASDEAAAAPDERLLAACMTPPDQDSVEDVSAALSAGADINARDPRSGQTCLMAATLRGKINILRHLLSQGADASIPEKNGYTPPHGAGFQGRADVMKILKEEASIDVINAEHPDGFAPLHRACWGHNKRHAEVVQYLLEIGEDVNRKGTGDRKMTCLAMTKNPDTISILTKYGAESIDYNDEL